MASGWKSFQQNISTAASKVQANVQQMDFNQAGNKLGRGFSTFSQQLREGLGQAEGDDVTELPEDYKSLERRVDALRNAHTSILKIAKAYETETYDYPTQINESLQEATQNVGHVMSFWAASAAKGTNLPQPSVIEVHRPTAPSPMDPYIEQKAPEQHKTLSHALSRAAAGGAVELTAGSSTDRLGNALQTYSMASDKVGNLRLEQDHAIARNFTGPWSATLNGHIAAAMKSRTAVKSARLHLDACRARAKGVTGPKAEQLRLDIEAAEESLVNATEEAINQMRAVLESPSSLVALKELVKAQQAFHAKSAEVLAAIEGDLDEAATQAEGDYRKTRA